MSTEPHISTEQLILVFTRIRDARTELKRVFEAEDGKLKEQLSSVENELTRRAQADGVKGFKTDSGTSYISEERHISIGDDDAFYNFMKNENDPTYLERRPSLKRVQEYMDAHGGKLPPGITMFREVRTRVRAPTKGKGESDDASTAADA